MIENMQKKITQYIDSNGMLSTDDTVIVGLSGGADSVCLLRLLLSVKEKYNLSLVAVHVNHGIRGFDADQDEEFVRQLCSAYNVKLECIKKDIPAIAAKTKESEEECGRRIRYEIFREVANNYKQVKIAVAHHMNDQVETILFRMARGTGVKGISGMSPVKDEIIRPMLCLTRKEILDYLGNLGQDYRTDITNEDINYSRNYVRKQIVPELESINPEAVKHIASLCEEVDMVVAYMERESDRLLQSALINSGSDLMMYDASKLAKSDEVIRSYAIRQMIRLSGISLKDVTREHIVSIEDMLVKSESSRLSLPRGIVVIKEANRIYVTSEDKMKESSDLICVEIDGAGEYDFAGIGTLTCEIISDFDMADIPQNTYTKWFDYDKISNGLSLRNRAEGDYLTVNKSGGHKKLKDYYIDLKIPKSERDLIPILAIESEVVWVVGHRISESYKVTNNTTRVLKCCYVHK